MAFVERGDARIYLEVVGEGPPLLLIAGIASDVASWAPVIPLLEQDFRLIMFDNRGAGRTEHGGSITAGDWIADAVAVLDHLSIEKADVIGHSLGGMIALRLAERSPDRTRRLIASATTADPEPKSRALLTEMAALYEGDMEAETWFRLLFQWLFAPPFFENPDQVTEAGRLAANYEFCQSPADFRRQVEAAATLPNLDVAAVVAKTLLLLGERDIMVTPQTSRASFSGLPNGREVVIPGSGHSVHWDQPEAFAEAVTGFLKD